MFNIKYFVLFLFFCVSSGQKELLKVFDECVERFLKKHNISITFTQEELEDIKKNQEQIKKFTQSNIDDYTKELGEASRINLFKDHLKKISELETPRSENDFISKMNTLFQRIKNLIQIRKEYELYKQVISLNKESERGAALKQGLQDKEKILNEFEKLNVFTDTNCTLSSCEKFYIDYSSRNEKNRENNKVNYGEHDFNSTPKSNSKFKPNTYNYTYNNDTYETDNGILFKKEDIHRLFGISTGSVLINSDEYLTKDENGLYVYDKYDQFAKYNVSLKSFKISSQSGKYIVIGCYKKDLNDFFIVSDSNTAVACYKIGSLRSNNNLGFYISTKKTYDVNFTYYYFLNGNFYKKPFKDWFELKHYQHLFDFEEKYLNLINQAWQEKINKKFNFYDYNHGNYYFDGKYTPYYKYSYYQDFNDIDSYKDDLSLKKHMSYKDLWIGFIICGLISFLIIFLILNSNDIDNNSSMGYYI